ncbi:hypothetical protein NC652_017287 [Populus alba x Populus x berolinensis]|uniref:Uncharacterized protein n=1 Tax=Populus alba x Populus x berolinensis TaxID=444605 RepID=A0AAD6QPU2_9ROSI|nr:hypothetical protein NC652_017287 [Populus alba x Populus x berolinensis]KAJ6994284.1 hypothetical protein NC653_017189 [Populus alba x Populus x berolinensis]
MLHKVNFYFLYVYLLLSVCKTQTLRIKLPLSRSLTTWTHTKKMLKFSGAKRLLCCSPSRNMYQRTWRGKFLTMPFCCSFLVFYLFGEACPCLLC